MDPNDTENERFVEPIPLLRTDWAPYAHPSTAVVEAAAAATNRDSFDIDVLHDYLDPDSLDSLLASSREPMTVSFEYAGVIVVITADGTIEIWPDSGY